MIKAHGWKACFFAPPPPPSPHTVGRSVAQGRQLGQGTESPRPPRPAAEAQVHPEHRQGAARRAAEGEQPEAAAREVLAHRHLQGEGNGVRRDRTVKRAGPSK